MDTYVIFPTAGKRVDMSKAISERVGIMVVLKNMVNLADKRED